MSNPPFDMNDPYGVNAEVAARAAARKAIAERTAQADEMLAIAATRTTLVWPVDSGRNIRFELLYGPDGNFTGMVITTGGNRYPLARGGSSSGWGSQIEARLVPVSGPNDLALAVRLNLPGLQFEGYAMQFSSAASGPAPETVW